MSALLSSDRKLLPIALRGADWKELKKNSNIEKSVKDRILAAWHFEAELKEQYYGNVGTVCMCAKRCLKLETIFVRRIPEEHAGRNTRQSGQ